MEVVLETSIGNITIELYSTHAPRACKNFSELARTGYYDSTKFHRVIKNFIAQGGDPSGTGRGGTSIYGGTFEDEITRELKHVGAGVVSMANGSQFFVTLAPAPWLDGKHPIFGGMGTVRKLGLVACDSNDAPLDDITILRAYPKDHDA